VSQLFSQEEVRKALATILEPRAVFEVRALDARLSGNYRTGIISGYFDNADACLSELERLTSAVGVYVTLNPVDPALLSRCANRLDLARKNSNTGDQHIVRRLRFIIDVDPDRPSGISATDAEKAAAKNKAQKIYRFLKERGWPEPLVADSGNGYHLVYLIDLPVEDDQLIERLLAGLAARFDGDGVKLDRSVFNPSRIARLYGTLAAKGDNTKERPHRLSRILKAPESLEVVSVEQLRALAEELQPAKAVTVEVSVARSSAFDVEGFLARYGVAVAEAIIEQGGTKKWRLEHCPFNPDHETPDAAVFQFPDGKLGYKCLHTSCIEKHWKDFRRHFEPYYDYSEFVRPDLLSSPAKSEPVELPPPPPPYVPPPLDLLPGVLQDYVHAAARSLNVDVSFILLPQLSALGSAIGNSRSIILKRGFVQPPVIWTGVISPTGSLKSPGLEAGSFPVLEHERELKRQNQQALEQFEEDHARWKSETPKKRGPEPEKPVILTCLMDDLTLEVLSDRLAANPRGVLIVKDEISHWFASFDQYKNAKGSDVSRWLSLHTAVFLAVDRLTDNRHHRIWMPRAPITGGIQPKVFRRVLKEEFFERGLPARFLFAYPETKQTRWSEETVSDELQNEVRKLFANLWLLQPEHDEHGQARPKLLRLDDEAKQIFVAFYNQCGAAAVETDEHGAAAWSKLSGYAARLALVGQLARDPNAEIVTGDTMKAACDLAGWFGREGERIYALIAETPEQREQRRLIEFIVSRGGSVTVREVTQSFRPLKNKREEAEAAFNKLVAAKLENWGPISTTDKGGRPTRKFQLLPLSTSTKPHHLRGKAGGIVDVDTLTARKNTPSGDPDTEAETLVGDESGVARL
jgi:hypothetical protein